MAMQDDLKFRRPRLRPYVHRLREHWRWGFKSIFMADKALRQRVSGKNVLITGTSSGIGELAAKRLAAAGATVLMTARSKDKLESLADTIRQSGGRAFVYAGNLADMEDCDRVCQDVLRDHGHVDILINNAARSIRRSVKFTFDRFHDYERTMQLNFFGSIRMAMNILPGMLARNEGHIVNVSTLGVQTCPARFSAYLSSKWALEGWSWVTANELAHTHVRVSTINYPLVRTPMIAPSKVYRYMIWMLSPDKAVDWMMDILITRKKRKINAIAIFGLFMYYFFPKISESAINLLYQGIYEEPPESYAMIKKKAGMIPTDEGSREA